MTSLTDISVISAADRPPKIALYGPGGIGKTTLASEFPSPVFLPTETGTIGLEGIPSFPLLSSFDQVMDALRSLYDPKADHPYRTVIVDSISQLELLVWDAVCRRESWKSIEQPGYGRGYAEATIEWKEFLTAINYLREGRGILPILIAHEDVRPCNDPTTAAPYDRVQMRLHKRAEALIREDADILAFMTQEIVLASPPEDRKAKRPRSSGQRLLRLAPRPAWTAKCRYRGVPEEVEIDLDEGWASLADAVPAIAAHGRAAAPAARTGKKTARRKPARDDDPPHSVEDADPVITGAG